MKTCVILSNDRQNLHTSCVYKKRRCGLIANEITPQGTKITQKLTTIGHRTAFNNEQSPNRIVSYKRPRNDNVKQFK